MKNETVVFNGNETSTGQADLPKVVNMAGANAYFAWDEFFAIENTHTKMAYERAIRRFLALCDEKSLVLTQILPGHVSEYEKSLKNERTGQPASKDTRKQHVSAIRKFFEAMVIRHAVLLNPAKSVRGAKVVSNAGKTPPIPEDHRRLAGPCDLRCDGLYGCSTRRRSQGANERLLVRRPTALFAF